eukprot:569546-Rhodomonas_salina.4
MVQSICIRQLFAGTRDCAACGRLNPVSIGRRIKFRIQFFMYGEKEITGRCCVGGALARMLSAMEVNPSALHFDLDAGNSCCGDQWRYDSQRGSVYCLV